MSASGLFRPNGTLALFVLLLLMSVAGAAADDSEPDGLEPVWSIEGRWTGVAADHTSGTIFALGAADRCLEIDAEGKTRRDIVLPGAGRSVLRFAGWPGKSGPALLAFRTWAKELRAYDLNGKELWTYPVGTGIDDVWPVDLTRDDGGVAVGYNGNGGLHLLDTKGKMIWKSTAIGNVWHVSSADVLGKGTNQIVTTSAKGQVHIFSSDGKEREDRDVGLYANMVRVGRLSEKDESATIIAAGAGLVANANRSTFVAAISGTGDKLWALEIPVGNRTDIASAMLARDKPWLAVATGGGQVYVIDAAARDFVASVGDQGPSPEVAWLTQKEPKLPLLVVAAGGKLNAFRFVLATD